MTIEFKHKDQEFFEEVCKLLPSFAKRFQEACAEQWTDPHNFIYVGRDSEETSFHWYFHIPKKDIKRVEIEDLKPFVWYPASKWHGNPEGHALVERYTDGRICAFRELVHALADDTEFFMFVPKNKDIKPKC